MSGRRLAEMVVHRHECDCASASRPLGEGEEPQHRLDIDGQPFPWHITEEGPIITKLGNGYYTIRVEIFARAVDTDGPIREGGPS